MWWGSNMHPHSSRVMSRGARSLHVSTNSSGQPWPAGEMGWATPINALDMDLWICQNGQRQCHWPYDPVGPDIESTSQRKSKPQLTTHRGRDRWKPLCLICWTVCHVWSLGFGRQNPPGPIRFLPVASPVAAFTLSFLDFLDFFSSSGCSSMKSHLIGTSGSSQVWVKSLGTTNDQRFLNWSGKPNAITSHFLKYQY